MATQCAYLFLGDDEAEKQRLIDSLKAENVEKEFQQLDCEVVNANDSELSPARFNEILSYAPSSSKKRVVLIRRLRLLGKEHREILLQYFNNPLPSLVLLLDGAGMEAADAFCAALGPSVKRINLKQTKNPEVFDLCRAVVSRNTPQAITMLGTLLRNREKSHHILGGLIWQWENMKERITQEQFKKGLQLLLQTDLKIKTGRLKEDLALELLVIRLASLL